MKEEAALRPDFPPVIVIGSARSGTTLLTRILERFGLFVGRSKTKTYEALFFQRINKWLLVQCGGGIETPNAIQDLLDDSRARSLAGHFIRDQLQSSNSVSYLGFPSFLTGTRLLQMPFAWGWKDPRATFTLPIWLDIFPEARVIHILRHGVDVAASLRLRQSKILDRMEGHRKRLGSLYSLFVLKRISLRRRRLPELRCASLEGGLSVWDEYASRAHAQASLLGERALEVRFEDLLARPVPALKRLAEFCGLTIPDDPAALLALLDKSRALAYRNDPRLVELARREAGLLAKHGY